MDVVAVSLPDVYSIALHNLKADETLFTLKCEERLTSLAFRTDNFPVLVGGSENGSLFMWDLESKCGQLSMSSGCRKVVSIQNLAF